MKNSIQKIAGIIITLSLIGGMIFLRTQMSKTFDYQNSNFAFFWLSGRMILEGESPYNETQYLAGHDTYGIKWRPNNIFPYPLPLALIFIPFGLISLANAYILWQIVSLVSIALIIFILLNHWKDSAQRRLLIPIFAFMFFFGPLYLTLFTGSIGAIAALVILGAILLFEKDKSLLAGIVLSLTILKPPQGLPILLLAGIWFLARRDWKAILGVAIGGISLLLIGMIQDPLWAIKFLGASQAVMDRTQGVHSNVWAFSYLACGGASPCSTLLGGTLGLVLLGLGGFFLWQHQAKVTAWEAFNIIIPIAFVSTIYLWAYDQLTYIIPIVWIVGTLVERTKSYIHAFLFLIVLDVFSFYALVQQAATDKDLWSLGTTVIVLGMVLGLLYLKPIDKPSPLA
ncbi:MAG TPA: glycosyltransferase family 87 protein [Anaerolineales bacterium]|nr:glycosyltransferase family 87 protein [Anaerolineales bacterium]